MSFSLKPQHVNEGNWYYENAKSITVVHEVFDRNGNYVQTDQFKIPLSKLKKSIKRIESK
jgi:hypothetical protein